MKTALIPYRVADFLRQHPPFASMPFDDVLALARSGRVAFHEPDEFVYFDKAAAKPWIYVIQQGRVELVEERPTGPAIRDLLSAGDLFGLEALPPSRDYSHGARTASDVILYAIEARLAAEVFGRNVGAERFLRVALDVQSRPASAGEIASPARARQAAPVPDEAVSSRVLFCEPARPARDIAEALAARRYEAAVVVDENRKPLGLLTAETLLTAPRGATASESMRTEFLAAPSGGGLEDYLLAMARARDPYLVLTNGNGEACTGLLTEATAELFAGVNPSRLIRRLETAQTAGEIRMLTARAFETVGERLRDPDLLDWPSEFLTMYLRATVERVLALALEELGAPPAGYALVLTGPAARGEILTPSAPAAIVVHEGAAGDTPWFETLLDTMDRLYAACGLAARSATDELPRAGTLETWAGYYRELFENPILNGLYPARSLFDLDPIGGHIPLGEALIAAAEDALAADEIGVPVLANDSLSSLPPLTFFEDFVVNFDGTRRQDVNLTVSALDPLADVARVFTLASGSVRPAPTVARLEVSARRSPAHAALFQQAAEAFRTLQFQRTRNGIRERTDGSVVYPAMLSKYEQLLLKSGFRAVLRLMDHTYGLRFTIRGA